MTKKQDWLYEDDDMMGEPAQNNEDIAEKQTSEQDKSKKNSKLPEEINQEELTVLELESRRKLEDRIDELEKSADEYKEKYLHAMAETDTVRRRSREQIEKEKKFAVSSLLEELIPILDSFNQSVTTVQETDHELVTNMREGMVLTLQMLQKALGKFGVKEIDPAANETFNPAFHEVMMAQENKDVPPNTILSVLQKGYQLHDRVIRPARVIVAKAPN
jgi:molecular chaperone GrpE